MKCFTVGLIPKEHGGELQIGCGFPVVSPEKFEVEKKYMN